MAPAPERYHALDSLRAFAMFLGIVLHAGLSFVTLPPVFWPVRDARTEPLADLLLVAIHDFRMQLFFLLAGFFGCLLYLKYGALGTAWHRVKRVAIPFVLAVAFVVPTVMAAFLYAELENARAEGVPERASPVRAYAAGLIAAEPEKGNVALILDRFTTGDAVRVMPPAHLWFLYYLLVFFAASLLASPLLERLSGTRFLAKLDRVFRRVVKGRGRVLLPALCAVPVLLLMNAPVVDTQVHWAPVWHLLLYYGGFFAFGWALFRHRDLVETFGRGWRTSFAVANVVVLPLVVVGLMGWKNALDNERPLFGWRVFGFVAQSLYTWLMIVGLWGAFLRYFARGAAWTRYLSDASYWCYLASITPTVVFQFAVKDWPLPGLVKWVLVSVAVLAVLLASYELFVRYTFIGAILNGRKTRKRAEVREPKPVLAEEVASVLSPGGAPDGSQG